MNRVLFFSDNKELIIFWSSVLGKFYQTDTVLDINADSPADLIIIDADKINQNKNLLSLFKKKSPRFLVIGDHCSDSHQIEVLVNGAAGYCHKSDPTELLLQAVESILKGDIWIQRHLVSQVIGSLVKLKSTEVSTKQKQAESSTLLSTLSKREHDVAKMIRHGDSNKVIAASLYISERTVKAHLTSIFKKLKISDRLHLALFIKELD